MAWARPCPPRKHRSFAAGNDPQQTDLMRATPTCLGRLATRTAPSWTLTRGSCAIIEPRTCAATTSYDGKGATRACHGCAWRKPVSVGREASDKRYSSQAERVAPSMTCADMRMLSNRRVRFHAESLNAHSSFAPEDVLSSSEELESAEHMRPRRIGSKPVTNDKQHRLVGESYMPCYCAKDNRSPSSMEGSQTVRFLGRTRTNRARD
jgi:hypothetical protein